MMIYRKKLIEVALPLEAINKASMHEKTVRHGHPSNIHPWWARRPLAACRAVLFASLVDDPSSRPNEFPTEEAQQQERDRLFDIIEELVKWENSNNEVVLQQARAEIMRSTDGNPPPVLDPFAGSGSIPLEAQRLGLEAHASDLNPVAVLINKALIEIPPKFAGQPPVNPEARKKLTHSGAWKGAQGLAEDVRYYGKWMRDEAEKRIGHLYPKVQLPKERGGGEATVIAWLWARTVPCPNPACGAHMPLVRSFALSTKKGRAAWVEPIVDRAVKTVRFMVCTGENTPPEGTVNRRGGRCLVCNSPVPFDHIRAEGKAGRMEVQLMAIASETHRGRAYLPPFPDHEAIAKQAHPQWRPDAELPNNPRDFKTPNYGIRTFADLFTPRQLVALTTFSDLISEVQEQLKRDAAAVLTEARGVEYSNAVATYLSFAVDKLADLANSICPWEPVAQCPRNLFARQAIPMQWNFAEGNPLGESSGSWAVILDNLVRNIKAALYSSTAQQKGVTNKADAITVTATGKIICTDPPYYDNIGYADLSDFFYVWLRRSLSRLYPDLFDTMLVPKSQELVATPYRFGGDKKKAQRFFEEGLAKAFVQMRESQVPNYPLTVFYAFKQSETDEEDENVDRLNVGDVASTGWETMLEALLSARLSITGTWPMRTEMLTALKQRFNNLASSIVLVCRPRPESAPLATRREFIAALRRELPDALRKLQHGNIAPVDLAQAAIGPGMAVFSRYSKVVEANGDPMRVRTALQLINQALDEVLAEQEGDYDNDTRWAIAWFDQYGTNEGLYGVAETLSKAKNTSISGLAEGGILQARGGKVKLLSRDQLPKDWNPTSDRRSSVWEVAQHLIHALDEGGEYGAATLLARIGAQGETARDLAYRLYTTCERKGWAAEALAYNSLVVAWPAIMAQAAQVPSTAQQGNFFS